MLTEKAKPPKKLSPFKLRYGSHGFFRFVWANIRANAHVLLALWGIIWNRKEYMACREIRFELRAFNEKFGRLSWLACECGKVFWMRAHGCDVKTLGGYRMTGKFPDNRIVWRGNA